MEKHEFMSERWLEMARREITSALQEKDIRGVRYSLTEEFTDPPKHLRHGSAPTIGFCVRIDDGEVDVEGRPTRADVTVVSDYGDALAIARDPDAAAADPRVLLERVASGRMRIIGDPSAAPAVIRDLDIHRLLSARTA